MGKEPLYGWNWGQAFLDEETLYSYSYDKLQDLLKKNKKSIMDTMKGSFHLEWDAKEGPYEGAYKRRMDMVEDLLEYVDRIQRVLERRGYRAKTIRESLEFERGKDTKSSLDIGKNRKIRKGDRFQVTYKGEKYTVTALDDEEEEKHRIMVRSGQDFYGGREPEYETRTHKTVNFIDDDGGICYAEARQWWDNQGNEVWDFEVPEYENPKLSESVNFERGADPKESMNVGKNRKFKEGDQILIYNAFEDDYWNGVVRHVEWSDGVQYLVVYLIEEDESWPVIFNEEYNEWMIDE